MDIVTKSFRKDETLTSWTLLQHICPHFWAWLLNTIAITPKSEDKYVVKVFNWSEVHLSEMTCYKIHTLKVENSYLAHFWVWDQIKIPSEIYLPLLDASKDHFYFLFIYRKEFYVWYFVPRFNIKVIESRNFPPFF